MGPDHHQVHSGALSGLWPSMAICTGPSIAVNKSAMMLTGTICYTYSAFVCLTLVTTVVTSHHAQSEPQ